MRTVQEIYDEAIHLIDAENEQTGSTETTDAREYKVRAAKLLSSLLNEAFPCSDTYADQLETYSELTAYAPWDRVTYKGGRYRCLQTCQGISPENTAYWALISRPGKRPVHPPVTEMTDVVDMDDFICLSVLPAGLAALFVLDEDKDKYNAYWGDYQNRLAQARATLPAGDGFEDVENPYSFSGAGAGIEYGWFGRW